MGDTPDRRKRRGPRCFFEEEFKATREALKKYLCHYFSNGTCNTAGSGISPMGATPKGGKILKVRWAMPGCGKSGGLRLAWWPSDAARRAASAIRILTKDDWSIRLPSQGCGAANVLAHF